LKQFESSEMNRAQNRVARFTACCHLPAVLLCLALARVATAQEALRYSMAGQEVAEARKLALDNQKFNVKMGPVSLRFSGRLGIEATDNVHNSENNPQADLGFRPQLNMLAFWRVTEKNSLSLGMGLGYVKYLQAKEYDNLFITPDTDLSFDVYVGDFAINLHDRFDYTADVASDPTISGTGSLNRFENLAGFQVVWDLNKAFISAGYDHENFIAASTANDYLTHSAELLTATVGFHVRPTVQAGLQAGGGLLDYKKTSQTSLPDNQHASIGPFVSAQLSEYTSVTLGGGYVTYFIDAQGLTNAASTLNAYYLDFSLRQRVGNLLTHTLSFGRSVQSSIGSQLLDLWQIRHSAAWNILRKTGVGTTLSYEHGTQSGVSGETLDRYGAGISLSRTLTKNATGSLGYQFYLKNSDVAGRGYLQNRLVLDVAYTF
jgi:hypothetical protein